MMSANLQRWVQGAVVSRLPQAFRLGKMPYLFVFEVLIILVAFGFAPIDPNPQTAMSSIFLGLAVIVHLVLTSRGMPLSQTTHLTCLICLGPLLHMVWFSGGVWSPRLTWLLVLPVIPFYIISPRAGYVWLGVVFAAQIGVAVCTAQGWLFPAQLSDEAQFNYAFATFSMATVMLLFVPLVYDQQHRSTLREGRLRQKELEKKQAELEQAQEMREHFIASVSHELRTPMNAILGFNSLLIKRVPHNPRAFEILEHTRQSADHLMTVINDVLDYSQFLTGRLTAHAETFALRDTVQHAFDLFAPRVKSMDLAYRCEIDADVPEWASTDRHRLMQILVNLLGNALKFTHQGQVLLRVQTDPGGVLFSVEDTGIGIALEDQPRIFQRFIQAQGEIQKRYGGTGLGLAITQSLVALLQGEIGFDSTPGQGSRFWFRLPLTAQTAPQPLKLQARKERQTAGQAWQFLVVDDHHLNRLLVQQILKTAWPESRVVEAENGVQALDFWRAQRFDLVLMDMLMPVMDGVQTTQAIRQSFTSQGLAPVIGLTANVNPQELERFKDAGLSVLLLKPFDPVKLCDEVEALLLRGAPLAPPSLAA
ncbi:ATP-binding protein [Limnohabitans sp. Rim8]|uniref:ATP-binding protein n=1 Tax=Limnohabitans sp. Rim8 TaxID=1100718 RepID=UPI00262612EC|nr:ATP-binding protein [Limnohabitans sp. Rim8]